jgi:hypothetical protein
VRKATSKNKTKGEEKKDLMLFKLKNEESVFIHVRT